ncbi:MAG: SDR family oxidoreductase [Caldilineaceae bacterium]
MGRGQHPGQLFPARLIDTPLTVVRGPRCPVLREGAGAHAPPAVVGPHRRLSGLAVFLASDASNFITGAVITVDGGFSVNVV